MADVASITSRVRLELGDKGHTFQAVVAGDGTTRRFDLPKKPVDPATFSAVVVNSSNVTTALVVTTDYLIDADAGVITLATPLATGSTLVGNGTAYRYFLDTDYSTFVSTAAEQHLHASADAIGQQRTLENLPVVEEYLVAILAVIEALFALLNDAAFDIDISTPEGVQIPRSQRYQQLLNMIQLRQAQYNELAQQLNVGLNRIEMYTLRRVSRQTNRLVPVYIPQEVDDHRPPRRVYPPIDQDGSAPPQLDIDVINLDLYQGDTFGHTLPALGFNTTGYTAKASLKQSPGDVLVIQGFAVAVTNATTGVFTIALSSAQSAALQGRRYFWDFQLTAPGGAIKTYFAGSVDVQFQVTV